MHFFGFAASEKMKAKQNYVTCRPSIAPFASLIASLAVAVSAHSAKASVCWSEASPVEMG
jgi:hypothetical protein